MPNPIVWLNDTLVESGSLVGGASQVNAGPDGRYIISRHFLGGDDDVISFAYTAGGTANATAFSAFLADPTNFPDAAYLPDGRVVMAWTQTTGGNQDIYFKVINGQAQGFTAFSPAAILANSGTEAGNQTRPVVTGLANGNFALSWFDGNDNTQKVRVFDILGNAVSAIVTVNPGQVIGGGTLAPANIIALDGGGFAVGFERNGGYSDFSIFNPDGSAVATNINAFSASNDDNTKTGLAQLADGRIVVVSGSLLNSEIHMRFYSEAGVALSGEITIALPGVDVLEDFVPRIAALNDGRFMVVFSAAAEGAADSDIWGMIIKADGTLDGTSFRVNDTAGPGTGSQSAPSIAVLADGRVVVSWTDNNTGNGDIVQKIYDPREAGLNGSASSFGDDWRGTVFSDNLYMGEGNDQVNGGAGNDFLYGEGGNDLFYGEAGIDYIRGGVGNDGIYGGDDGDSWLSGEVGNDNIYAGSGNDRVDGGDGEDGLYGEEDRDYITGGNGNDNIAGGSEVGAGDIWLGGDAGDDSIFGEGGNDRIDGGTGADTLFGEAGADYITGGAGIDNIQAGAEADSVYGGADADFIYGGDEVGAGDTWLGGDAGVDTINGDDGNDRIDGGADGDFLYGGAGLDYITGGGGDDLIEGGAGTDTLIGNAGADTYDFNTGSNTDTIIGFEDNIDTIQIDAGYGFFVVASVIAATTISGGDARINLPGGFSIYISGWISGGHTIAQLGDDIVIA